MSEKTRYDEMREAVERFHAKHPEVWLLFDKYTRDRIEKGFKNYSAKAVFERIRWDTDVGGDGKTEFKVGNNFPAFYARAWMDAFPEHEGFFRTRVQTSMNKPATGRPEKTPEDV